MLDFEETWQKAVLIGLALLCLIYTVYLSVKDIKWENRAWWQKGITMLAATFMLFIFYLKVSK